MKTISSTFLFFAILMGALANNVCANEVQLGSAYIRIDNFEAHFFGYCGMPDHPELSSGTFTGFNIDYMGTYMRSNTSAITPSIKNKKLSLPPSSNPTENCLYFKIGGNATIDQSYSFVNTDSRVGGQQYDHVKFDWRIVSYDFGQTEKYLQLSIPAGGGNLWSVGPGYSSRSGHVDMNIPYEALVPDITFVVSVVSPVPEPSCILALLSGISGLGILALRRKK